MKSPRLATHQWSPYSKLVKLSVAVVLIAAFSLILAACGGEDPTAQPEPTATRPAQAAPTIAPTATLAPGQTPQPAPTAAPTVAGPSFEQQWEQLIAAAKQDGELIAVLGGSASRNYRPVYEHFADKFGINLSFSGGSGTAAANRILAERSAGKYTVDILATGGTTTNTRLVPAGALDPVAPFFIHPEVLDESLWYQGHHWFTDVEQKYGLIFSGNVGAIPLNGHYNTNLVSQAEIDSLTSTFDYFQDKWKDGKIVSIPPVVGGAGGTWYSVYVNPALGPQWIETFIKDMKPFWTEDYRLISDGVVRGKFHWGIAIGSGGRDIDGLIDKGLPAANLQEVLASAGRRFKEPGDISASGSGNTLGIANRQPNPNATKLFLNWFLSKEGQTVMHTMSSGAPDQSLRTDVTDLGKTEPHERRQPGVDYLIPDADPELLKKFDEAISFARKVYRETTGG